MSNLSALGLILVNTVLPVFLIASIGFVGRRALSMEPAPVARVTLYLLVPALLFQTLLTTQIQGEEIVRIGAFAIALTLLLVTLGTLAARLSGASRSETAALVLSLSFLNAANYGLPVNLFAFGQDGFDRAAVFVIFESVLTYTIGVFIAAGGKMPWGQALGSVFRMPLIWAATAAVIIRATGLELPLPIQRAASTLSGGAIPVVLLLLGMQIAGIQPRRVGPRTAAAVAGRLAVSPLIGLLLVGLLGTTGVTSKVLILEAAMPTAVNATLLASAFDAEPELVSTIALVTTALSLFTITAWLAYLQTF